MKIMLSTITLGGLALLSATFANTPTIGADLMDRMDRMSSTPSPGESAGTMTESGMTESGMTESGMTESGMTESGEGERDRDESKTRPGKRSVTTPLDRAKEAVRALSSTQQSKLLALLNEGSAKELSAIRGISKGRSQSIMEARPFHAIEEIIEIKGIGQSTFAGVLTHGKNLTRGKTGKS